jgi:hypothetical protein
LAEGVEAAGPGLEEGVRTTMPGVLKRPREQFEEEAVMRNTADANVRSTASEGLKRRRSGDLPNGEPRTNGFLSQNGVYANGLALDLPTPADGVFSQTTPSAGMSDHNMSTSVRAEDDEPPPEIFHVTQGYVPLSRLFKRLAQLTFNELNEVIEDLDKIEDSRVPGSALTPEANIQKKTRLFDFGQQSRTKFIKALVISQWARHAEEVGRVIDLNHFISMHKALFRESIAWVGELKKVASPSRLPPPDLKVALRALSTGRADWISDVGGSQFFFFFLFSLSQWC